MIRKAKQALSEARFFVALERLIPKLDVSMPTRAIAEHASLLFKLADPASVKAFSESPPQSLREHADSRVRALCARLSRGTVLREALKDSARNVRAAAIARLNEVGETMPDSAPLVDVSDEYYASIAQRLVNDFPDRASDWVDRAVAAVVSSYRSTSGVALDAKKLKKATKERLAEISEEECTVSCLDEAIEALSASEDEPDFGVEEERISDDCVVERARLPKAVSARLLEEHGAVVTHVPARVTFSSGKFGSKEREQMKKIASSAAAQLRGCARVSWSVDGRAAASLSYRS